MDSARPRRERTGSIVGVGEGHHVLQPDHAGDACAVVSQRFMLARAPAPRSYVGIFAGFTYNDATLNIKTSASLFLVLSCSFMSSGTGITKSRTSSKMLTEAPA